MSYDLTLKEMKTQRNNQELDMLAQKAPEVFCVFHQQFGSFYTQLFGPTTPLFTRSRRHNTNSSNLDGAVPKSQVKIS